MRQQIDCLHLFQSVPSSGHVKWYSLEKKSRNRGAVKLKLAFSSEKNSQVAAQEHRHLLRFILLQEMEHNKVNLYLCKLPL